MTRLRHTTRKGSLRLTYEVVKFTFEAVRVSWIGFRLLVRLIYKYGLHEYIETKMLAVNVTSCRRSIDSL